MSDNNCNVRQSAAKELNVATEERFVNLAVTEVLTKLAAAGCVCLLRISTLAPELA